MSVEAVDGERPLAGEQKVPRLCCCISDARELWRRTGKQQAE